MEGWIEQLLPFEPGNESERNGWLFCLAEMARQSGLRAVDVSVGTRSAVLAVLRANPGPGSWKRMVEEVVATGGEEQARMFGESLPIGLRLALGASRGSVMLMVLKQAAVLGAAGIIGGIALALASTRLLTALLFEVSPTDPLTFALGGAGLMGLVIAASAIPAGPNSVPSSSRVAVMTALS